MHEAQQLGKPTLSLMQSIRLQKLAKPPYCGEQTRNFVSGAGRFLRVGKGGREVKTPLIVANTFIDKYGAGSPLTHMKLQKLVFYTDGWSRAFGRRFISEKPQVWRYGPVYRSLYNVLAFSGGDRIVAPPKPPLFVKADAPMILSPQDDEREAALVDWVWDRYGKFDATSLSTKTHEKGTPWQIMAEKYDYEVPPFLEIDDDVLDSYFKGLARAEGLIQPNADAAVNPA